jgi:hypothetical protein
MLTSSVRSPSACSTRARLGLRLATRPRERVHDLFDEADVMRELASGDAERIA